MAATRGARSRMASLQMAVALRSTTALMPSRLRSPPTAL